VGAQNPMGTSGCGCKIPSIIMGVSVARSGVLRYGWVLLHPHWPPLPSLPSRVKGDKDVSIYSNLHCSINIALYLLIVVHCISDEVVRLTRYSEHVRLAGGWWLVLVCSKRRVLLVGCWVADLFLEKSTACWWLISQANRLSVTPQMHASGQC
jgi:hypothetical protein